MNENNEGTVTEPVAEAVAAAVSLAVSAPATAPSPPVVVVVVVVDTLLFIDSATQRSPRRSAFARATHARNTTRAAATWSPNAEYEIAVSASASSSTGG